MENESATSLYVQACKFLLCGEDRSSWDQLIAILPRLRNALTCRVCRGLIVDPLSSGYCQHYVCRACLKRKRALNPGCKWCLDFSKLRQSDEQIRVVLACYKLLCEAIRSSSYYEDNDQNLVIANLLREAKLNLDVLPNSKILVSNNSQDTKEMAENIASRDQLKTCAREKVDITTAVTDGGKAMGIQSATNGILEHCIDEKNNQLQPNAVQIKTNNITSSDVAITVEANGQLQPSLVKMETDNTMTNCNGTSGAMASVEDASVNFQQNAIKIETDDAKINCSDQPGTQPDYTSEETGDSIEKNNSSEINNNGTKTRLVSRVKAKKICLRPRSGQLVQRFEPRRHMRKRKLVRQTLNQNNRPRKKCKIGASK